jgi:hypothetical protein
MSRAKMAQGACRVLLVTGVTLAVFRDHENEEGAAPHLKRTCRRECLVLIREEPVRISTGYPLRRFSSVSLREYRDNTSK